MDKGFFSPRKGLSLLSPSVNSSMIEYIWHASKLM